MREQLRRVRAAGESGFTTIVVISALLIGTLLVGAAFTIAQGDTGPARSDQYAKQAYAAAEAGVNFYLAHLLQDSDYWKNCYTVPAGASSYPVNRQGADFSSPSTRTQAVPGSQARYEIELLNPRGQTGCSSGSSASIIDASTGRLSIRSTGSYGGVRRSIVASFGRPGFLGFLWFTDKETQDPDTYSGGAPSTTCAQYYRDGRSSRCGDQQFITGDSLNGPVHTNDIWYIGGRASFGRSGKGDALEATDPAGCRPSPSCLTTATWNGGLIKGAGLVGVPTANASLKNYASADGVGSACAATSPNCWLFTGPVHITLGANGVQVVGPTVLDSKGNPKAGSTLKSGVGTWPPNGVIYVDNGNCKTTFPQTQTQVLTDSDADGTGSPGYPQGTGCGDAWVHGAAGRDVTVAAKNDVIIDGDITHATTGVAVGLIPEGFVRVYHPCAYTKTTTGSGKNKKTTITDSNWSTSPEDPGVGYLADPKINAAILSLKHSFLVDNWGCGSNSGLGSLHVTGAIAQYYRGTVGTNDGSGNVASGYLKDYSYDATLKQHQPPYFLEPTNATWELVSETEQVPAH
ncbi:MAG TPA: hypothetical protein VHB30_13875 [Solirubrobacteraceae bacterium]|jgi:hypothetical protein|nr:hypothetical protein [Solirubrobacteraceae bacterium]